MFHHCLNSIFLFLVFLNLETSALKCYRCGTLTAPSGPGRTNGTDVAGRERERHKRDAVVTIPAATSDPAHGHSILDLESCAEFEKPGSPAYLYEVTCRDSQICAKIVSYADGHNQEAEAAGGAGGSGVGSSFRKRFVQRGCASRVTAMGQPHPIGCGFLYPPVALANGKMLILVESEHICYCDDANLCNSAPVFCKSPLLFFFLPFLSILKGQTTTSTS